MSRSVRARLAGLMFLQYFVMGLWAVTLAAFLMGSPHEGGLNLTARHVGLIYGTMAIGATVAPLFVGLLADRLFATQRVLAVLHLLGAGLLGAMVWWCGVATSSCLTEERVFPPLFFLMLAYACAYLPTITLSNALAFRNLPDPARQYGPIRALGTVGWVAAGLFVGFAVPAVSPLPFLYAAIVSALLAALCLMQPHTPPAGKPKTLGDALGLPALRMLADRSFLVYVLTAVVATFLMPFHNSFANKFLVDLHVGHAAAVQTLAQPTEIAGAVLIPWLWVRWGAKRMLLVGLVASAARFALYATQSVPGILVVGLPLHGIGFSLFFIAAAVYVDRQAPPDLRASAQGLVTLLTIGAGGIVGNWFAGRVVEWHTAGGAVDWAPVWLVPAAGTLAAAVLFALFFQDGLHHGGTEGTEEKPR